MPTIGIGKKFLQIDGLNNASIKEQWQDHVDNNNNDSVLNNKDTMPIVGKSGRTWGVCFVSGPNVKNPVFISVVSYINTRTHRYIFIVRGHPSQKIPSSQKINKKNIKITFNKLFFSQGTGLSLETTVKIVKRVAKTRIPEPVRKADLGSRAYLRKNGY